MALLSAAAPVSERVIWDAGTRLCKLNSITVKPFPNFNDKTVMENKIVFEFESLDDDDVTENGLVAKFSYIAPPYYSASNDKNKLRWILHQMTGKVLSKEEYEAVDTDNFVGKQYNVHISTEVGKDTVERNKIVTITPVGKKKKLSETVASATPPVDTASDSDDPFADN